MKKNILRITVFALFVIPVSLFPQFLQGVGIFLAETSSRDRYKNLHPLSLQDDPTFLHAKPPSHKATEYHSWGVGIFLSMLNNEKWRWRTEIEYANKGFAENELLDPITDAQRKISNTYKRIQWNNYLKRYIDLGLRYPIYALIGARIEYGLGSSTPAYSYVSRSFTKLLVSSDAGLGIEFPLKRGFSLFVEEHYNPDVMFKYGRNKVFVTGRTWETRVGLIYRWKRGIGAYDIDCNAPRFRGK